MDQRQKSALRKNHITLADQLILDEDFFAQLRQIKIFSEGMISIIKAETKPRNQVYKMLELLEKRGPHAFNNFISILRENFWWVADKLEETYEEKMQAAYHDRQDCSQPQSRQNYNERPRKLQRAVSTPLQSRVPRPVPYPIHTSASTGQFPIVHQEKPVGEAYRMDNNPQQPNYSDSEDEIDGAGPIQSVGASAEIGTENIAEDNTSDNNGDNGGKNYVDKSLSPIHILECRPKKVSDAMCSPEPVLNEEEQDSVHESDNNEDNTQKDTADSKDSENVNEPQDDAVDGNKIVGTVEAAPEGFESSETFYDSVRAESVYEERESSFYLQQLGDEGEDSDGVAADGGEELRSNSSLSSHQSELIDREDEEVKAIREIYLKLQWLTDEENQVLGNAVSDEASIKDIDETGITFQMIIDKLDELVDKHTNSDLQKLITSCYKFFDDKDKKLPLYVCIEKLLDSKNELNSRLLNEMRKTNEMAHDMYLHSQDMKSVERLKSRLTRLDGENGELRERLEAADRARADQARRIADLEAKLHTLEDQRKEEKKVQRRTGISPKRNPPTQGLTPRGQQPRYQDPRMAIMQTGYQTNKSPRTQATTSAWRPFKK